jgi:hypothetical protein
MSLLDGRDAQPTLQVSPGALLSDQPRSKESKIGKRKSGGLSKKGKHARNNRTPPDSPRGDRIARGGKNQPSPTVKSHRKRYSHLGLDLSGAESDEEEEEEDEQTYFANQAASEATERTETFFTIETEGVAHPPTSPGPQTTVQFPVQFEEASLFPLAALEPQHPLQSAADGADAWSPTPPAPLSALEPPTQPPAKEKERSVPEAEWRVSVELRLKCCKQFHDLQPTQGHLQGDQARAFFIQSRLPNADLSAIWLVYLVLGVDYQK